MFLSQILPVSEVTRTLDEYAEKFNALGLLQEKLYKQGRDVKKAEAKTSREADYKKHIDALNAELAPCYLVLTEEQKPDFIGAMKNQRLLSSLYEKLDAELARAKIEADSAARLIRANLGVLNEQASEYRFLFNDLQSLIVKPLDDFTATVKMRIAEHKQAEEKRLEQERERIRAEEQAAAQAVVQAKTEQKPESFAHLARPELVVIDDNEPFTLNLSALNARLGFTVSADFLASIGFEAHVDGRSKLYRESQFKPICAAIIRHLQTL